MTQVYERLDESLGQHLDRAGADTTVWVQFNHGMGPHYDGEFLLDEVLVRLDHALTDGYSTGWRTRTARRVLGRGAPPVRALAARAVAAAARYRLKSAPQPVSVRTGPQPWRRFFQIPGNSTVGAVRFNMIGRESQGNVRSGSEVDALFERLSQRLLSLINLDTGRPAVVAVVRAEEVLKRSPDDGLPDVFVEWDRSAPIDRVWSPDIGVVNVPYDGFRTGDHNDRGLVVVRGPGITPGRRATPMSLVDVAPTICAALGVDLPGTEGVVHADLIARGSEEPSAVTAVRPLLSTSNPGVRRRPTAQDEAAIAGLELAAATAIRVDAVEARLAQQQRDIDVRLAPLERERLVWSTTVWLAREEIVERDLISVVVPTYNRPDKLRNAIKLVLAQRYPHWELVVIDDGSDTAKSIVSEFGDDRITACEIAHGGPCAARNVGLDVASGDIITYLDDDNTLDPGWLHAVSWAFENNPERSVLYGARVIDDWDRVLDLGTTGWPRVQFNPFDRASLEWGNNTDMGVIAHRAGLPAARFDESLWECGDWDFLLALTEDCVPLELPAIAVYYRTDGQDRLTGAHHGDAQRVREKWARRRAAQDS